MYGNDVISMYQVELYTVKPVYKDHPGYMRILAFMDGWMLYTVETFLSTRQCSEPLHALKLSQFPVMVLELRW